MTRAGWPDLPALLAEIAEVAGLDAALAVAEAKGGCQVTIPARLREDHWLVRAVGHEKAMAISAHFTAGSRITVLVPLGPTGSIMAERRRRFRLVAEALAAGATTNQAAVRAGTTRRTVQRYKAGTGVDADDGGQGSLF